MRTTLVPYLIAAALCASSHAVAGLISEGSYLLDEADSDYTATVIITLPVNLQQMVAAPMTDCELRGDSNFGSSGNRYGRWTEPVQIDASGNASTTLSKRIRIRVNSNAIPSHYAVWVRCVLKPVVASQAEEFLLSDKPPAVPADGSVTGGYARTIKATPAPVLQVSGQAQ